jgi:hypothetical protein
MGVSIGDTSLPAFVSDWARAMMHVRPWVHLVVFAAHQSVRDEAEGLGIEALVREGQDSGGQQHGKSFLRHAAEVMAAHLVSKSWGLGRTRPALIGLIEPGTVFPDAAALVDTLYGVAADLEQRRIPDDVMLVARTRTAGALSAVRGLEEALLHTRPGTAERGALEEQMQAMEFESQDSHSFVLFTPGAVNWTIHQGLPAFAPAHVTALVREKRLARAGRVTNRSLRMVAAMGACSVIDITDTAPSVRARDASLGSVTPLFQLLARSGQALPWLRAADAELATAVESVKVASGEAVAFPGHVVVGWRARIKELAGLDGESEAQEGVPTHQDATSAHPGRDYEFERSGAPLLHVFTTLISRDRSDPQGEQKYLIQRNTLMALHFLAPQVRITVFASDSDQVLELCKELGDSIECSDQFDSNEHGTPLLKSMFVRVEQTTDARMFGYMNADILFDENLVEAIRTVLRGVEDGILSSRVLVVGQRINFQMPFPFNASNEYVINQQADAAVIKTMAERASVFLEGAMDFFFITKGAFVWSKVPDFIIGRPAYDNWLVDHAYHDKADRVDITLTVHAVHQNDVMGDTAGHMPRPDVEWNKDLSKNTTGGYDHGLTSTSNWQTRWHPDNTTGAMQLSARDGLCTDNGFKSFECSTLETILREAANKQEKS